MIMRNNLTKCERDMKNNPVMRSRMAGLASDFASDSIKLSKAPNRLYDLSDFNRGMTLAAAFKTSVGGYAQGFNRAQKSGYVDQSISVPSDTWFNNVLCSVNIQDALTQFERIVTEQLAILKKLNIFSKYGLTIAIDLHLIPRYDRNEGEELITSLYKKGTKHFEGYITVQCVDKNAHLVLGVLPITTKKNIHLAVDAIMQICLKFEIKIRLALLDREFFTVGTILVLDRLGIGYLMPCRNTKGVVDALDEFHKFERSGISECRIANEEESAPYTMIIVRRTRAMEKIPSLPKEMYIGFATNRPDIELTEYTHRWVIETGYSMIESIRPRTRSRNRSARLVCFLYAVLLFTGWVMINALMAFHNSMYRGRERITITAIKIIIQHAKQPKKPPDILLTSLSIAEPSGKLNANISGLQTQLDL